MLLGLKLKMLQMGVRQTRMAVAKLGWDPARLSRIVNEIVPIPSRCRAEANSQAPRGK